MVWAGVQTMTGDGRGTEILMPDRIDPAPFPRAAARAASCQARTRSSVQTSALGRLPGGSSASAATLAGRTPGCCFM